jgi:hypothetical protein
MGHIHDGDDIVSIDAKNVGMTKARFLCMNAMSRSTRLHGGELTTSSIIIKVKKKTSGDMRALNADRFIKGGSERIVAHFDSKCIITRNW